MIGTHSTFDDVEGLFVLIRALAQDLLPSHIAGEHNVGKSRHYGSWERR